MHVSRNIAAKVRVADRKAILDDFKQVYQSKDVKAAKQELEVFINKWNRKYPKVIQSIQENQNLFTYYEFPKEIRSSIYTTNLIEAINKQVKRSYKAKEQFPTEQSMEKYLVTQFEKYNNKFMNRIHKGFGLLNRDHWFSY